MTTALIARVRPEVAALALAMETKLQRYAHRGSWQADSLAHLFLRLTEEMRELEDAAAGPTDSTALLEAAADIANYAMIVCDNLGAITSESLPDLITIGPPRATRGSDCA